MIANACKSLERIDVRDDDELYNSYWCDRSMKQLQVHSLERRTRKFPKGILWLDSFDMFDI